MRISIGVIEKLNGSFECVYCGDNAGDALKSIDAASEKQDARIGYVFRSPDPMKKKVYKGKVQIQQESAQQEEPEKKKPGRPKGS